jgi:hypothetical protein
MRTLLSGICLLLSFSLLAQRECASVVYTNQLRSADPALASRLDQVEQFIRNQPVWAAREQGETAVMRIPVVVHVLYHNANENISDAQVQSQIDALNRDFRKMNQDTTNTPLRFKGLAADVRIEFALATADPSGRATSGIVRKQTNVSRWMSDDRIKFSAQGGDDAWDSHSYLNLWVGNFVGVVGYSSQPGSPAERDGVAIHYSAFGTVNVSGPYNMGRTAVHEIGHWLGLRHIWGDSYCGDDLVDDTPKQGSFTSGCPNGFRSTCSNGNLGDMYMNYMDYTNDACMNMFTEGQKQRMLALFHEGGPRNSLLSSKGLLQPWNNSPVVTESPAAAPVIRTYPNPVNSELTLVFEGQEWLGKTIRIVGVNGTTVSQVRISALTEKLDVSSLKRGIYFIEGDNGSAKLRQKLVKL